MKQKGFTPIVEDVIVPKAFSIRIRSLFSYLRVSRRFINNKRHKNAMPSFTTGFTPIVDFDIVSSKRSKAPMSKFTTGFTLIELLVVIAIIGMLSAIVFASLNTARSKAKDAAIKEEITQLASLMNLNYDDYGNYCNLQAPGITQPWIPQDGACSVAFPSTSGSYATQAQAICNNIISNAGTIFGAGQKMFYNTIGASFGCSKTYSFMVPLNNGKWYCSGSSGAKGEYASYAGQPGCFDNP